MFFFLSLRDDIRSFSKKVPQGRFEVVLQKSPSGKIWSCFKKNPSRKIWDCFPKKNPSRKIWSCFPKNPSGNFSCGFLENISHQNFWEWVFEEIFQNILLMKKRAFQYFIHWAFEDGPTRHLKIWEKFWHFKNSHVSQELKKSTNLVFFSFVYCQHMFHVIKRFIQGQPMDVSEIRWLSIWCTR